jgi:hypothetical protein
LMISLREKSATKFSSSKKSFMFWNVKTSRNWVLILFTFDKCFHSTCRQNVKIWCLTFKRNEFSMERRTLWRKAFKSSRVLALKCLWMFFNKCERCF